MSKSVKRITPEQVSKMLLDREERKLVKKKYIKNNIGHYEERSEKDIINRY